MFHLRPSSKITNGRTLTGIYKRSISHFLSSPVSTASGSNGKAVTLSTAEKTSLVKLTRKLAARLNRPDVTVTLGCGGQSTHRVIDEIPGLFMSCVELYDLYNAGKVQEATELQSKAATSEWAFAKGGINGSKRVVAKLLGYPDDSAACRRPYPPFSDIAKQEWMLELAEKLKPVEEALIKRAT